MGIASFSPQFSRMAAMSGLASPLQAVLALFMPSAPSRPVTQVSCSSAVRSVPRYISAGRGQPVLTSTGHRDVQHILLTRTESCAAAPSSKLKIVRRFEPGVGASLAGRMVISGRMADVCAELDRMEQKESCTAQLPMF